jgi:hypothetical protein
MSNRRVRSELHERHTYVYNEGHSFQWTMDVIGNQTKICVVSFLPQSKPFTALEDHCQVYVHCDNITGNYRSATVVVAYMIKYHDMLLDEAIDHVQTCRRGFLFGEHHFMNALIEYSIS